MARKRVASLCIVIVFIALALLIPGQGEVLDDLSTPRLRPSPTARMGLDTNLPDMSLESLAARAGLGARGNFRYVNGNIYKSAKGIKRVRLIQTYAGYDVFGSAVGAELDSDETFTGQMYGGVVKNIHKHIPNPEACQRNVRRLQTRAIRLERLSTRDSSIKQRDGRRIIYAGSEMRKAKLAYKIEFRYKDKSNMKRPVYYFDACTTLVLLSYDKVRNKALPVLYNRTDFQPDSRLRSTKESHNATSSSCTVDADGFGGNEKIGKITYNTVPFCLNVEKMSTTCKMEGTYSKVVDNEESEREDKQDVIEFGCSSGYSDAVNGAYGVANDAMFYGEAAGRLFEEKYNMQALDWKPRLVVHYGEEYENAQYDGTDLYFGDGGDTFHPFVDVDTVGHELAHGVVALHSKLIYRGMSGGIDEAFADITGEVTKFFVRNSNDWLMDFDIVKSSADFLAIRYFEDPTRDGNSIKHVLGYRIFMDVHFSSGVFNYAFYRMVEVEGMGMFEAYKCFLDANLNLWKPFTNFFTGACNVMQAAYDNGYNHRKVRRAFWRVGVPLIFCNYAALTTSMFVGETRQEVLVSATRSPILKVEVEQGSSNSTSVQVIANDNSKIQVVVGKDDEATQVITTGYNDVRFDNSFPHFYIKLASDNPKEVKVTIKLDI